MLGQKQNLWFVCLLSLTIRTLSCLNDANLINLQCLPVACHTRRMCNVRYVRSNSLLNVNYRLLLSERRVNWTATSFSLCWLCGAASSEWNVFVTLEMSELKELKWHSNCLIYSYELLNFQQIIFVFKAVHGLDIV